MAVVDRADGRGFKPAKCRVTRHPDRQTVKQATSQSVSQSVCQLLNAAFIMRRFALFSAEKIIRAARSVELDQTISWEYGK